MSSRATNFVYYMPLYDRNVRGTNRCVATSNYNRSNVSHKISRSTSYEYANRTIIALSSSMRLRLRNRVANFSRAIVAIYTATCGIFRFFQIENRSKILKCFLGPFKICTRCISNVHVSCRSPQVITSRNVRRVNHLFIYTSAQPSDRHVMFVNTSKP